MTHIYLKDPVIAIQIIKINILIDIDWPSPENYMTLVLPRLSEKPRTG